MAYTPPATSDINFLDLASFTPPVTSDLNFDLDPVSGATQLEIQNATQAVTVDNVTLTQKFAIVIDDATQAVTADNVTLTQKFALVIDDATQAVTADNVKLTYHAPAAPAPTGAARGATEYQYRIAQEQMIEYDDEEILMVMYA